MDEQQARATVQQYPAIDTCVTRPKQMRLGSTMHYVELMLRAQCRRFTCRWPRQVDAVLFAWTIFLVKTMVQQFVQTSPIDVGENWSMSVNEFVEEAAKGYAPGGKASE